MKVIVSLLTELLCMTELVRKVPQQIEIRSGKQVSHLVHYVFCFVHIKLCIVHVAVRLLNYLRPRIVTENCACEAQRKRAETLNTALYMYIESLAERELHCTLNTALYSYIHSIDIDIRIQDGTGFANTARTIRIRQRRRS